MMKGIKIGVTLLGLLAIASCKKDEKKTAGDTKSELLSSGKWQLIADTYQNFEGDAADPIEDNYKDLEDCEKDDFIIFSKTKSIIEDKGAVKCSPGELQQTTLGQWELIENGTIMHQSSVFGTEDWDIEQLDDQIFKFSYSTKEGTRVQKSSLTYTHIK